MSEIACENVGPTGTCDTDNKSFKAYMARWMAATTKVAPFTYDTVIARLRASAKAAALQCSGGTDGETCGLRWTDGATYDGNVGVGQQLAAMEVFQTNLLKNVTGPVKNATGGTSKGNPLAGTGENTQPGLPESPITNKDRAGAGFLTTLVLISVVAAAWWMIA